MNTSSNNLAAKITLIAAASKGMGAGIPKHLAAERAAGVVFLASPGASWLTGETLYVAGGLR